MSYFEMVIIAVIGAACFWGGSEWRDYQTKQRACAMISNISQGLDRELPADHPCKPYL